MIQRTNTGPTPHSVAMRVKFPLSRPLDHLMEDRRRQDAARDEVLEFTKNQQTCDIKTSWLQNSEERFLRGTIERRVQAALDQQDVHVQQRRDRLRVLLDTEQQQLLQEMEGQVETPAERQAKMRERASALRDRRERDRQQFVSDKMDQLFREQCEELRAAQSRRRERQVCSERAAQVRWRQERLQQQQQEENLFHELWEADRRAKEELETQRTQRNRQRNLQQLDVIKKQMEAAEQQRRQQRELREEEALLTRQQQEMQQLQQQREQQQKLQDQQRRRRELDEDVRLKMKRLSKEQQDELQVDMDVLQQLLQQETDERQDAAQRKAELRDEQQRFRQFLREELQKQRREEEEIEQLMEENLKEAWNRREEQNRVQREARNRLMEEVMEARRLQIQHKLDMNIQRQASLSKERDELNRAMEDMKLRDEDERRRQRRSCETYRADLQAQMQQQQQRLCDQRLEAQRENQLALIQQRLYNQRRDQILTSASSHTAVPHPFRRAQGTRSASTPHIM